MSRALGGGALSGAKLVRLVYVDEAGISNPKQEPFTVVVGVIVHADESLALVEDRLDAIVARHIPAEERRDFVFHAKELFNGGKKRFKRDEWSLQKRLAIADELAEIPASLNLPIAIGVVSRGKGYDKLSAAVVDHVVAFVMCAQSIEAFMRTHTRNEVCLLIVEDNSEARSILRIAQQYLSDKSIVPLSREMVSSPLFPFTKIKEDPLFASKRTSTVLQMADFCAYVCKRMVMKDDRYRRFAERFEDQVIRPDRVASFAKFLEQQSA